MVETAYVTIFVWTVEKLALDITALTSSILQSISILVFHIAHI